jgi:cytochrome c-type biogenesis protein CcmE
MSPRQKRLLMVAALITALVVFFFTPTQVANGEAPQGKSFRIGGLVVPGSLQRETDGLKMQFAVTDQAKTVQVHFQGILPDLFKEGAGVVAQGMMQADGRFLAKEVLAKHDENYMPPEAAEALKKAGHPVGTPEQFQKAPTKP